jgi:hypothetical protein
MEILFIRLEKQARRTIMILDILKVEHEWTLS